MSDQRKCILKKRGKKTQKQSAAASYQTVLEEGCRRSLWVTVQRWRARRLCCQSKAQGRWVLERTVERKREKKRALDITSWLNPSDHRSFAATVLICVSNKHDKKILLILCRDKQTDPQSQIGPIAPLHPQRVQRSQPHRLHVDADAGSEIYVGVLQSPQAG